MGMDIYGIAPKAEPLDDSADIMTKWNYQQENGIYFGVNCWWYRPLQYLMADAIMELGLYEEIDVEALGYNDGMGCEDAQQCIMIADQIEEKVAKYMQEVPTVTEDTKLSFSLNAWEYADKDRRSENVPKDVEAALTEKYGYQTYIASDIELDGVQYKSMYTTDIKFIKQFCTFLRNCGGFQVW